MAGEIVQRFDEFLAMGPEALSEKAKMACFFCAIGDDRRIEMLRSDPEWFWEIAWNSLSAMFKRWIVCAVKMPADELTHDIWSLNSERVRKIIIERTKVMAERYVKLSGGRSDEKHSN